MLLQKNSCVCGQVTSPVQTSISVLLDESYNLMVSKSPLGSKSHKIPWETLKDKEGKIDLAI